MDPSRVAGTFVQRHVKYLAPVPVNAAEGQIARVYDQIAEEMRVVIPPAQLHSPVPDLLAAYWMLLREPLLPTGRVSRSVKEVVAAAVSVATTCPYCAEMHGVGLYDLATEHDAEKLADDLLPEMTDPDLRAAAIWARHAHETGPDARPAALPEQAAPELVGVLVALHYLCRVVNVFLSPFLLPPRFGPRARRRAKQGISRLMRPTLRDPREPGRSVGFLPVAPGPAIDAGWAGSDGPIADAVARAGVAFGEAGRRSVPAPVRAAVHEFLDDWHGEDPGLSTGWCRPLLAGLSPADEVVGRLALLTCAASYRIGPELIAEFRRHRPGDVALLDTVAWASFATARLIGARQNVAIAGERT